MFVYPIAEAKAHFSELIKQVEQGKTVRITRGVRQEEVAVIVPTEEWLKYTEKKRDLGSLKGKMKVSFADNWYISDDDLLST